MSQAAFFLQDFFENKNGRHPDCIEAIRKHGTIKGGRWLYIDRDKVPEICEQFNPMKGKDCVSCGQKQPPKDQLQANLEKEGIQWGDLVSSFTKRLGLTECPPCTVRKEILNTVKERGWLETIKLLKETL